MDRMTGHGAAFLVNCHRLALRHIEQRAKMCLGLC
jgi:hypothetical protein